MRRSLRCDLVFTLVSAMHHGQGVDGNVSLFRTGRFIVHGEVVDLPYLSGNALKHTLIREPGVRHMLRVLEVPDGSLGKPAIHLLFSGGALSTKGSSVSLAQYRDLCELVPILALVGGAVGNYMLESAISVGDARPVCDEHGCRIPVKDLLDAGLIEPEEVERPVGHLMDMQMGTRHDPLRSRSVAKLLTAEEQKLLVEDKSKALATREAGDHAGKGDSQQMLYERQVMAAGAKLHSRIYTRDLTEMEEAALWSAVGEWLRRPFLGANSSVGNGEATLRILPSEPISVPGTVWEGTTSPVAAKDSGRCEMHTWMSRYDETLRERKRDILAALGGLR